MARIAGPGCGCRRTQDSSLNVGLSTFERQHCARGAAFVITQVRDDVEVPIGQGDCFRSGRSIGRLIVRALFVVRKHLRERVSKEAKRQTPPATVPNNEQRFKLNNGK